MKIFSLVLFLLSLTGIFTQSKCSSPANGTGGITADSTGTDTLIDITISAVGDLMCHSTQYNYARVAPDSFNFVPCFEYILPWLKSPDLLIGNLETTFAGTGIPYSGYPYFNTPDDYATAIKEIGFDFIVTANNHANDNGEKAILRTIGILDGLHLPHTGTYVSENDRDSIRIMNISGIKISILSYTYSTNGLDLAEGKPWLVNFCDSALIKRDIINSRGAGAELVVVFYHFGEEYERLPNSYQKDFVNHAIDCGADVILGSHPHVLQPVNYFATKNAKLDTGFVAYSMGNFISNQQDEYTDEGVVINIHIQKNIKTNKIRIERTDYVPTWVYKGKSEVKKLHMVFPVFGENDPALPDFVQKQYSGETKKAWNNTTGTMNIYTDKVQPVKVK
ncbi:MAG: CapA family protein [Chitinophagales bacterium]